MGAAGMGGLLCGAWGGGGMGLGGPQNGVWVAGPHGRPYRTWGQGEMGLPRWLGRGPGQRPPSAAPVPPAPRTSRSWALPPAAMPCQRQFLASGSSARPRQSEAFLQTLRQRARAVREEGSSVGRAHRAQHGVKRTQPGVRRRLGGAGAGFILLPSHAGVCRGSHRRQAACLWVF